jgi:hypothetical protein
MNTVVCCCALIHQLFSSDTCVFFLQSNRPHFTPLLNKWENDLDYKFSLKVFDDGMSLN